MQKNIIVNDFEEFVLCTTHIQSIVAAVAYKIAQNYFKESESKFFFIF